VNEPGSSQVGCCVIVSTDNVNSEDDAAAGI
jgi:hypothetical protein